MSRVAWYVLQARLQAQCYGLLTPHAYAIRGARNATGWCCIQPSSVTNILLFGFRLTDTWTIQTQTKLKLYLKYLELIPRWLKPKGTQNTAAMSIKQCQLLTRPSWLSWRFWKRELALLLKCPRWFISLLTQITMLTKENVIFTTAGLKATFKAPGPTAKMKVPERYFDCAELPVLQWSTSKQYVSILLHLHLLCRQHTNCTKQLL